MNWLEISLTVEGELAEAVADVLSRHIQQGVATELKIDDAYTQSAANQVVVRGYIPLDGSENERKEHIERDLWHLRHISQFPEPSYQLVQQKDWTEQWRQHYHPMPLGERLLLVPAWYEPPESKRRPLILEPGMAFGTGTHPTTRLCIEELENHIRRGERVFDVGCGSGILSIASVLLGAGEVVAMDVDPAATLATIENAERNEVSDKIEVISGSLDELFLSDPKDYEAGEIVVANILTHVLVTLIEKGLARLMKPDGRLILSGILAEQMDEINQAAQEHGLELCAVRSETDWRAMVFKKKELPPRRGSSKLPDNSGG